MVVKFSKEVSAFIESYGSSNGDGWYWFPFYFKKVNDTLFEMEVWKDLPGEELTHIVERMEQREPKEDEQ